MCFVRGKVLGETLSTKGTIARPVPAEMKAVNRQIISTLYPDFMKDQTASLGKYHITLHSTLPSYKSLVKTYLI